MNRNEQSIKKTRIIITGDSLLCSINDKGLAKENHVKIQNFPGRMTESILNEVEELVKSKPDSLIVHVGANDIAKCKNVLTNVKKISGKSKKVFPRNKSSATFISSNIGEMERYG